jgi:hypothetical protein
MVTSITRKKVFAIILTILIWGLGHAYVHRIKRGVTLFFLGVGILLGASFIIPFPFLMLVGLGYVLWLIYDVLRIIQVQSRETTQAQKADYRSDAHTLSCKKCGGMNKEDSSYSSDKIFSEVPVT